MIKGASTKPQREHKIKKSKYQEIYVGRIYSQGTHNYQDCMAHTCTCATQRFSLSMEMSGSTRDHTAEPVSRDQILRCEWGQGNIYFPCSADHEQDWQPSPVDPYSCYSLCDGHITSIYIIRYRGFCILQFSSNVPWWRVGRIQNVFFWQCFPCS